MIDVKIIKKPKGNGGGVISGSGIALGSLQTSLDSVMNIINNLSNALIPVRQDGTRTQWGAPDFWAVKSVKGFYSEEFVSARGLNPFGTGGVVGATELRGLSDVAIGDDLADGHALVYDAQQGMWVNRLLSQGLDEAALADYLILNKYAKLTDIPSLDAYALKTDIPSLSGYATQIWVEGKGYALASDLNSHTGNGTVHITATERTAWNAKLDASVYNTFKTGYDTWKADLDAFKAAFESMFVKESDGNGGYRIKALFGLYTDEFLSARGLNGNDGSGSGGGLIRNVYGSSSLGGTFSDATLTDTFNAYTINKLFTDKLDKTAAASTYLAKTDAASLYQPKGSYLTAHQDISGKVDKVDGKGLSSNDFTSALLTKLNGIEAGANKYTHPTGGADTAISAASGTVLSSITVNSLGHVTAVGSKTLAAADIPTLAISKISGLQTALDSKLDAAVFNELFEKVNIGTAAAPVYAIKAKFGFYSEGFVSAHGANSSGSGGAGGTSYNRLDAWTDYATDKEGYVLSAKLGYGLHTRLLNVYSKASVDSLLGNYVDKTSAQEISGFKTITAANNTGCSSYNVGMRLTNANHQSIEVVGGNYTMGLGCHSNGSWYWWRGTNNPTTRDNKSYVMDFDGTRWKFYQQILASSFVKDGGTSAQFLKADGSVDGNAYALSSALGNYLPLAGGTLTGLLTVKTSASHSGIKLGDTYLTAINGDIIFQNNNAIRFGSDAWDYNKWAGLKYDSTNKYVYLGLADGSAFVANASQSGGAIITPGISNIYVGNNTSNKVWHAGNDGSGSGLDADLLDGVHLSALNSKARYITAEQKSGFYKIKIKSTTTWMLYFRVRVYQNYQYYDIDFSGYNYNSTGKWHDPKARLVSSSLSSVTVYFGYDSANNLWVAIPATYYTGISIVDVVNGYTPVGEYSGLFEVEHMATLSGTVQATETLSRSASLSDNVASATKLQTARTIWGQSFDGTGNVSGNMTGVGSITASGTIKSTGTQGFLNQTATGVWAYMRLMSNANLWDIAVRDTDLSGALQFRYGGGDTNRVTIGTNGSINVSNSIVSSKTTTTHLAGNQGAAIINSTASAGSYTMLAKMNSTNGYFTLGSFTSNFHLYYTAKSVVDAQTNSYTHDIILLDESGLTTVKKLKIGSVTLEDVGGNLHIDKGVYSDSFVSARGQNSSGGGSGGGLVQKVYGSSSLGGSFDDSTLTDTFNAYTINKLYHDKLNKYKSDGVLEIARYLDFHTISNGVVGTEDFSVRLDAGTATGRAFSFPATGGVIATESFVTGKGYLTSHQALDYLNVKDVRGEDRLPTYFADRKASFWFNMNGTPSAVWYSGLQVKGWTDGYASWEICANSHTSTSANDRLYFRTGINGTWQAWKTLAFTTDLSSYLPLSGGTLTGTLTTHTNGTGSYNQGIRINRTALGNWATLTIGYVGATTEGSSANMWLIGTPANSNSLIFNLNSASETAGLCLKGHGNTDIKWNNNTIWHAGNDGSGSGLDADLLDGLNSTSLFRRNAAWITNNTDALQCFGFGVYLNAVGNGTGNSNFPENYGVMPVFSYNDTNYTLRLHGGTSKLLKYQIKFDGINTEWFTLARITDNVASATKLQTARKLWGQSFDGTANVCGELRLYPTGDWADNVDSPKLIFASNDSRKNDPYLQGVVNGGGYGKKRIGIFMHNADSWDAAHVEAVSVLPNGNVGVGTTAPSYLHHVNGTAYAAKGMFGTASSSYALNAASFICDSWVRSKGATGWYNETYGGGWYMTEATWIRTYNNKSVYAGSGVIRTDNYFDRQGYAGAGWNNGYGAYNTAVTDNTSQTPLMVAYRAGQTAAVTGANRLFAAELLNSGAQLNFAFGGEAKQTFYSGGGMRLASSQSGAGGDVGLELWRGTNASWKVVNTAGTLKFQCNYTDKVGTYFDCLTVAYNTGDVYIRGKHGIGTTAPAHKLDVNGDAICNSLLMRNYFKFYRATGNSHYIEVSSSTERLNFCQTADNVYKATRFWFSWDGVFWASAGIYSNGYVSARGQNTSSDERLKRVTGNAVLRVRDIANAPAVRFVWRRDGVEDVGSLAQYWRRLMPQLAPDMPDGSMGLQYGKAALLGVIAVARETESLEKRVVRLERENRELKRKLELLERR